MKSKQKFNYNPARELVGSVRRVARRGIDPGETIRYVLGRRPSDIGEGTFETHLSKHHEE